MNYIWGFRYVKLLSYILAKKLQEAREESHKARYGFYYGFQLLLGEINKILLLIIISLPLGTFVPTLVATGSFAILRVFAGGSHFKSYKVCSYVSLSVFIFMGVISKNLYLGDIANSTFFLFTLILVLLYSPVENESRHIEISERKKLKIISTINLLVLYALQYFINDIVIKQSISNAVVLAGVIVAPLLNNVKNVKHNIQK